MPIPGDTAAAACDAYLGLVEKCRLVCGVASAADHFLVAAEPGLGGAIQGNFVGRRALSCAGAAVRLAASVLLGCAFLSRGDGLGASHGAVLL